MRNVFLESWPGRKEWEAAGHGSGDWTEIGVQRGLGWDREVGSGRQRVAFPGWWTLLDEGLLRSYRGGGEGPGSFILNKIKGKDTHYPLASSSVNPPCCGDGRT